jgi:YVTN family beta-propeller protein
MGSVRFSRSHHRVLAAVLVALGTGLGAMCAAATGASASTLEVSSTIGVGSDPWAVAVDAARDTIYVANEASDTISVIDGATNKVSATIPTAGGPIGLGLDPANGTLYVSCFDANELEAIDTATNTVTGTIATGSDLDPRVSWANAVPKT